MAIARGAGAFASVGFTSGFSISLAHDAGTGTGRYLIVFVYGSSSDASATATYNAVPMTLVDQTGAAAPYVTAWMLPNPTTGTNNIIVSGGFVSRAMVAFTYTGVDSTPTPDAVSGSTDNATFVTSLTMSTTTVAADAWTFYGIFCSNTSSVALAGTGASSVGSILMGGTGSLAFFDAGPHGTPGAQSMQSTHGSASNWRGVQFSLAPDIGGGGGGGTGSGAFMLLCG